MATINGAKAFKVGGEIGSIEQGRIADLVLYDARGNDGYMAVIDAEPSDVCLVIRGGETLYGNSAFVLGMPDYNAAGDWEAITVGGVEKLIATPRELATTTAAFSSGYYPLPFADGAPAGEPDILPTRTDPYEFSGVTVDDADGDGIPNASDNAPNVFNPLRAIDGGVQVDSDGDGRGDEGDPTPFGD